MSEIKQVIVVRTKYTGQDGKSFGARKGKLIAQCSHAAMAFITRRLQKQYEAENPKIVWVEKVDALGKTIKVPDAYASAKPMPRLVKDLFKPVELEWINGIFAKVCCQVRSEEELL
jgi:peptidyl-tRNA hydrolase